MSPPRVVVVGAGFFGLAAAKAYTEAHSSHLLTILEASSSVGGTWSKERVYSGLISHNGAAGLELAGLKTEDVVKDPLTKEGYTTGIAVAQYLEAYAARFELVESVRFNTRATEITRDEEGTWRIALDSGETMLAEKVIIATGLTSEPFTPKDIIPIKDARMKMLHSVDLHRQEEALKADAGITRTTVYGGSKSAFDAVFLLAEAGKQVDWIIRASGSGPCPTFAAKALGKTSALLSATRLVGALMSPCIWNTDSLVSRIFHQSAPGRAFLRMYYKVLTNIAWKAHGLDQSESGRKLKPTHLGPLGHFWTLATPSAIGSEPRFWEVLKQDNVRVHRADIVGIEEDEVVLSDGQRIRSDAHIWATGYIRNNSVISPPSLALACGAPVEKTEEPAEDAEKWSAFATDAEKQVLATFPMLKEAPPFPSPPQTRTPHRLYRFMVSPTLPDHSLVHVGTLHTSGTGMMASLQGIWATAYLSGSISLPSVDEMQKSIALDDAWCRKRYLSLGEKCSNVTYEYLPYFDLLMRDLGVEARRKKGLKEWVQTYTVRDYEDVMGEWRVGRGRERECGEKCCEG